MGKDFIVKRLIVAVILAGGLAISHGAAGAEQQPVHDGNTAHIEPSVKHQKLSEATGTTEKTKKLHVTTAGKKYSFTPQEVSAAKRAVKNRTILTIPWQQRLKKANTAFANDYANVKQNIDFALKRGEEALATCSVENYSAQDLQKLCQANESVQDCLNRLMTECKGIDNAFTGWSYLEVNAGLQKLKTDIELLEKILFEDKAK